MQLSHSVKVLIIDDDAVDRKFIGKRLKEKAGGQFEVFEAANHQEAADAIESQDFDCLLVDYLIPPTTSLDFINQLREKYPDKFMGIILLAGKGNEYVAVEALKAGAHDYLNKEHLTSEAILRAVKTVVSHAQLQKRAHLQQQALINFAGTVVHDLKTPLSGIFGYLQLAQLDKSFKESVQLRENVDLALTSASYMKHVIDGIYEYVTSGGSGEAKVELSLREIAAEAWRLAVGQRNLPAELDLGDLPDFHGQVNELIQLFQNLFANAIKHAGETVQISITAEENDTSVRLCITDNGPGVPPEHQAMIFAPLNKGASRNAGTGLGLAICSKIVENHNGRIWCTSGPEGGARFFISLPKGKAG